VLKPRHWMTRCLGLGHYAWGTVLLLLAAWLVTSVFRTLPYMSNGSILSRLPTVLLLAVVYAGPLGLLGTWIVVLGHWVLTGHTRLRTALLVTHGLLMLPGLFASILGVHAMRAASRSAAQGGGLLSPVAVIPLAIGAPVVILALSSIVLALTVLPKQLKSK
jgi:hypothetical protein